MKLSDLHSLEIDHYSKFAYLVNIRLQIHQKIKMIHIKTFSICLLTIGLFIYKFKNFIPKQFFFFFFKFPNIILFF